jgi:hypothetical protein
MQVCRLHLQDDVFLAVLDLAICHINSVHTLARLSVVSKRCKAICALQARHQLQALLLPVLRQEAAQPYGPLHDQHMSSIKWLCSKAVRAAVEAASDAIIAVPGTPWAAAHYLIEAGVRMSYTAVMAAALKQQPDAEVWIHARVAVHGVSAGDSMEVEEMFALVHSPEWTAEVLGKSAAAAAAAALARRPRFMLELVAICSNREEVGAAA